MLRYYRQLGDTQELSKKEDYEKESKLLHSMIKLKTKSIESAGHTVIRRADPLKRAIIDSELLKLQAIKEA